MGHAQNFCPFQGQLPQLDSAESIKGNLAIPNKALVRAAFIRDALKTRAISKHSLVEARVSVR